MNASPTIMATSPKTAAARPQRLAIGIATIGRAPILKQTLMEIAGQTRAPDAVIVCATGDADVAGAVFPGDGTRLLFSSPGLPRQRNAILDAAHDCDIVLFLDDDFLIAADYVARTLEAFAASPRLAVATGTVLADGIGGPGITAAEGRAILAADAGTTAATPSGQPAFCGYGCNMAVRMSLVHAHRIRVNERLPLYGWQEDVDFTRRLGAYGSIVRLEDARGVHLGTKTGRGSGLRLGYSQVANPVHLALSSKGRAYPYAYALNRIARNMSANILRSARPERYVDRRGRLRGNFIALGDLLTGRIRPERALDL